MIFLQLIVILLASIATIVGWVWITCSAGRESLLWGLACFFIGPLCLAYPILSDRFQELTFPWILFAVGLACMFILPAIGFVS